eukprot:s209_g1.t1
MVLFVGHFWKHVQKRWRCHYEVGVVQLGDGRAGKFMWRCWYTRSAACWQGEKGEDGGRPPAKLACFREAGSGGSSFGCKTDFVCVGAAGCATREAGSSSSSGPQRSTQQSSQQLEDEAVIFEDETRLSKELDTKSGEEVWNFCAGVLRVRGEHWMRERLNDVSKNVVVKLARRVEIRVEDEAVIFEDEARLSKILTPSQGKRYGIFVQEFCVFEVWRHSVSNMSFVDDEAVAHIPEGFGCDRKLCETTDDPGLDTLVHAVQNNDLATVEAMLTAAVGPNAAADEGFKTPLKTAIVRKAKTIAQLLLEAYADINGERHAVRTPLAYVSATGDIDMVCFLVERGACINASSPLYQAAGEGHPDVVRYLLEAGADKGHRGFEGHTPLMEAVVESHHTVVDILLEAEMDVNARNDRYWTPLMQAACTDPRARVNQRTLNGGTVLHIAAEENRLEEIRLLLTGATHYARCLAAEDCLAPSQLKLPVHLMASNFQVIHWALQQNRLAESCVPPAQLKCWQQAPLLVAQPFAHG